MKAKINKVKMKKNEILLSVGMIVKNEEKHLDNCLSALKKLLDRVPSELIIVDTGSTDRTKEIALKYTDEVYDFQWNGDFSAARNHGLKKARGKWFMSVDADEYLHDNIDEMVSFFSLPELMEKYNSASYYIVNMSSGLHKEFDRFLAPRMVKLTEGVEFHDKIHEWLPQPNPHGIFQTTFQHYGYAHETVESMHKKAERNLPPIMELYKKNPKDLRTLAELCDCIIGAEGYDDSFEKQEKYYKEYLAVAREHLEQGYALGAYTKSIQFYLRYKKNKEAAELIDEYVNNDYLLPAASTVSIFWFAVQLYIADGEFQDFEKAYYYIRKYFEYHKKLKNNELETAVMRFVTLRGLNDYDVEEQYMNAARCANYLGKYEEALGYLDKVDLVDMGFDHLRVYLYIIRDLVTRTHEYSHAARCYERILALGDDDKTDLVLYMLQQYYLEHKSERSKFVDSMISSGVKGRFIELMKLVKADSKDKDISQDIQKFIDSVDRWNDGYAEAIYLGMKHGADLSSAVKKMSSKLIKTNLQLISEAHIDYPKVAVDYHVIDDFNDDIKKLYWLVTAFECGVPGSKELSEEDKSIFFDTFVVSLSDYVMNIYNPDLLNEEDADVLPELHRFGYYMTLAFTAHDQGNDVIYIRMLKEALRLCESMKDVVSYYLSEFEKSIK